ncbi:Mce family protein [Gordonia araii NBRC 100433]|uniref:Mce family protein n=1 Tax=Gordonia araii NBRC 100433 TaxID=1073574 RepID=G7H2R7_9ACTN|nr:MCE family protein [Gordonia araii]NNG98532.1 MCE family protein [Gordonia araii NBRC 100433]GAB10142.1 Mce family protein [Gordonia araii NBRC 100433]
MLTKKLSRPVAAVAVVLAAGLMSSCSLMPAGIASKLGQAYELTAYFDSVAGLYQGNDVAVLGMPVGRVTKIEPEGARVKVRFTVDRSISVPKEVTAAIVNTSIVTTRHIELSPVYVEGEKLGNGDTVKDTKAPVEIAELFDSVDRLMKTFAGDGAGKGPLADFLGLADGITAENGQRFAEAVTQMSKAGKLASDNGDALVELIKMINNLTSKLVANYPKMRAFSNSVTNVAATLDRQSPGLLAAMADLNVMLRNTSEFLANNSGTIGVSTAKLAALAENLGDYSRQVVEAIDLGPLLFQNLSNSISEEQGAWRAGVHLDKALLDNEMLARFCESINLQKNGCRTGQLKDFGPDLGIFSAILEKVK